MFQLVMISNAPQQRGYGTGISPARTIAITLFLGEQLTATRERTVSFRRGQSSSFRCGAHCTAAASSQYGCTEGIDRPESSCEPRAARCGPDRLPSCGISASETG